jgi:hypothetical protein
LPVQDAGTRAAHGRRNVMLALAHGAVALAILALFVWVQAHK